MSTHVTGQSGSVDIDPWRISPVIGSMYVVHAPSTFSVQAHIPLVGHMWNPVGHDSGMHPEHWVEDINPVPGHLHTR